MGIQETLAPYQLTLRKGTLVEFINEKLQLTRAKIMSNPLVTQNKRDHLLGLKSRHYKVQEEAGREYVLNFGQDGNSGFLYVARKQSEEGKIPGLMELIGELTEAEKMEGHMREISVVPPEEHELNDPQSDDEFLDTGKINLSKVMEENDLGECVDMKQVRALQSMANTLRDKVLLLQADKLKGHISAEKIKTYIQEKEVVRKRFEQLKVSQGDNTDPGKASRIINEVMRAWEKLIGSVSTAEAILGIPMASESILQMSAIASPNDLTSPHNIDEDSKDDDENPKESTTNQGAAERDQEEAGGETPDTQEDTLGNIDSQVEKQKAEIQELEERIKFYRISQEESTRKFNDLIKQHNKDMEDIIAAQSQGSDQAMMAALEREKKLNKQLQLEIENVRGENVIFEQQNQNLSTKSNRLQSENNLLKESITKLEDEGVQLSTRSNDLQIRNNKLESQIIPLQQNIKQLEKEMDQATVDFLKSISELSNQNSLLRTQVEEAGNKQEEAVKNLKKELTTTKTALSRAEAELAKNTMAPKPNSLGPPTTGTTQPVAPNTVDPLATETEGRFRRLMIESETIAEKINQDVIKTKEDMEQMRSDVIKDAISIKGRTSRTKAMNNIIEFKQALRYFQSDADCGLIPANQGTQGEDTERNEEARPTNECSLPQKI